MSWICFLPDRSLTWWRINRNPDAGAQLWYFVRYTQLLRNFLLGAELWGQPSWGWLRGGCSPAWGRRGRRLPDAPAKYVQHTSTWLLSCPVSFIHFLSLSFIHFLFLSFIHFLSIYFINSCIFLSFTSTVSFFNSFPVSFFHSFHVSLFHSLPVSFFHSLPFSLFHLFH